MVLQQRENVSDDYRSASMRNIRNLGCSNVERERGRVAKNDNTIEGPSQIAESLRGPVV